MCTSPSRKYLALFILFFLQIPLVGILYYPWTQIQYFDIWQKMTTSTSTRTMASTIHSNSNIADKRDERNADGTYQVEVRAKETQSTSNISTYKTAIGIGLAITTRRLPKTGGSDVMKMPFFQSLLPSFCKTASDGYDYQFYLAYDYNDKYMTKRSFVSNMKVVFGDFTAHNCPSSSVYSLHFVKCTHAGKPAWAQNDAMIEAYLSGVEYFYRINDDTAMITGNWTERFINALDMFIPPRLGVVGPKHKGGNTDILTYDFTHRTHVDIHGFYYPREFPDWYADGWITRVYQPGRSNKLEDVYLIHTMSQGRRYRKTLLSESERRRQEEKDRSNILRYVVAAGKGFSVRDAKKVIAISLYNTSTDHTWGVIRNAQLMPVIYPGWTLKIYTNRSLIQKDFSRNDPTSAESDSHNPHAVLQTLRRLDAEVVFVDSLTTNKLPPQLWNYLVADDDQVEVFLIRRADCRIGEREYAVVDHWLNSTESQSVLGIKDHPNHINFTLIDGLWGARSKALRSLLGETSMLTLLEEYEREPHVTPAAFLDLIYSKVENDTVFYDSVTCHQRSSVPFPVVKKDNGFIGQKYNAHEQIVNENIYMLLNTRNLKCRGKS